MKKVVILERPKINTQESQITFYLMDSNYLVYLNSHIMMANSVDLNIKSTDSSGDYT